MESVDRVSRNLHGSVESERHVGGGQVVVDRLRDADNRNAFFMQARGNAESVFTADGNQRVNAERRQGPSYCVQATLFFERVGPRGTKDRPATRQDPTYRGDVELLGRTNERATPAIGKADEIHVVISDAAPHHRADHAVQAGSVTATGQYTYSHAFLLAQTGSPRCTSFSASTR